MAPGKGAPRHGWSPWLWGGLLSLQVMSPGSPLIRPPPTPRPQAPVEERQVTMLVVVVVPLRGSRDGAGSRSLWP